MEHQEVHHSHSNPGFGSNSGGLGVFIVALLAVAIILGAFWLWNNGNTEQAHYRLKAEKAEAPAHQGH